MNQKAWCSGIEPDSSHSRNTVETQVETHSTKFDLQSLKMVRPRKVRTSIEFYRD